MSVGQNVCRVDAYEKVTGRAKYTGDLITPDALTAKVLHSEIAAGRVLSIDCSAARSIPGVVKVITCFDVPDIQFPTAGHPWSTDPAHQDIADRKLLNARVRFAGDDIAAVVAHDEITARRALAALSVSYEEQTPLLDCKAAMAADAPRIHDEYPNNILKRTVAEDGCFDEAWKDALAEGCLTYEAEYETSAVQHCHLETVICCAWQEGSRIVVMSSTQIPHIARRIIAQALGVPWGKVRVIKPFIGGGFGNKQDALYEPLAAYLTTQIGGRPVKIELDREEVFTSTRVRHAFHITIKGAVRPTDGRIIARSYTAYANQGGYASHGHSIAAKGTSVMRQLYRDEKASRAEAVTVYTNMTVAGAMRGYGTPQAVFAIESHIEDMARLLGRDPIEFRMKNLMPVGFTDPFSKTEYRFDAFNACIEQCKQKIGWQEKRARYANQKGPVRRGIGMALFWYNTGVWPIALEVSSCRMLMNEDGSVQVQLGETEIGQGADTVFSQMAAGTLGLRFEDVHVITTQDTDLTPFGLGAYASRQSYAGGMAIHKTACLLKEKILNAAAEYTGIQAALLDIAESAVILKAEPARPLLALSTLATECCYSMTKAEQFSAEASTQIKSNAYSFGCAFAEVEVDIPLAKTRLLNLVNAHDCGTLLNPRLAEAQVHGGMSMAIGFALGERFIYDPHTGRLLNGNLLDYKIPTILDHPPLGVAFVEHFEPTSPYGNKALGEPPAVPGAAAIRNAILHATGVGINRLPLSPQTLFSAFKQAGLLEADYV